MSSYLNFIKSVYSGENLFRENFYLREKVMSFIGYSLLFPENWKEFRKHLNQRYCNICGEYIFCSREIHTHHHPFYKNEFQPLLLKRIKIHRSMSLVELQRTNPKVYYFPKKNELYPRCSNRIPALFLWTIDEWNQQYPDLTIRKDENYQKLILHPTFLKENPLFFPSLHEN